MHNTNLTNIGNATYVTLQNYGNTSVMNKAFDIINVVMRNDFMPKFILFSPKYGERNVEVMLR